MRVHHASAGNDVIVRRPRRHRMLSVGRDRRRTSTGRSGGSGRRRRRRRRSLVLVQLPRSAAGLDKAPATRPNRLPLRVDGPPAGVVEAAKRAAGRRRRRRRRPPSLYVHVGPVSAVRRAVSPATDLRRSRPATATACVLRYSVGERRGRRRCGGCVDGAAGCPGCGAICRVSPALNILGRPCVMKRPLRGDVLCARC